MMMNKNKNSGPRLLGFESFYFSVPQFLDCKMLVMVVPACCEDEKSVCKEVAMVLSTLE